MTFFEGEGCTVSKTVLPLQGQVTTDRVPKCACLSCAAACTKDFCRDRCNTGRQSILFGRLSLQASAQISQCFHRIYRTELGGVDMSHFLSTWVQRFGCCRNDVCVEQHGNAKEERVAKAWHREGLSWIRACVQLPTSTTACSAGDATTHRMTRAGSGQSRKRRSRNGTDHAVASTATPLGQLGQVEA